MKFYAFYLNNPCRKPLLLSGPYPKYTVVIPSQLPSLSPLWCLDLNNFIAIKKMNHPNYSNFKSWANGPLYWFHFCCYDKTPCPKATYGRKGLFEFAVTDKQSSRERQPEQRTRGHIFNHYIFVREWKEGPRLTNSQSPPTVMYFLQQGSTSPNPHNLPKEVPPTEDQAFKYLNLWETLVIQTTTTMHEGLTKVKRTS